MITAAAGLAGHYPELSIPIPIAIVAGLGDKIVDCDTQAGRLGTELPQSTLRKVPDAGHMIHHIVPEQVAAVILDVVRAALAAAGTG
jgi:pimeloyl-ACP methyl ester carboxylesterase